MTVRLRPRWDTAIFCVMFPNTVSEITHSLCGVMSNRTSKPLIVVVFDRSTPSAQGLPIDEFTRKFTPPIFVDVGSAIGRQKNPTGRELTPALARRGASTRWRIGGGQAAK